MNEIETIGNLCADIAREIQLYDDYVSETLRVKSEQLLRISAQMPEAIKIAIQNEIYPLIQKGKKYLKVWLYSVAINIQFDVDIFTEFLKYVLEENEFHTNTKYYLYYQSKSLMFTHINLINADTRILRWKLLKQVVEQFEQEIPEFMTPILQQERNQDLVLVITEQILRQQHGPTKIAFDRCKILIEKMNKQVLLINTTEVMSQVGNIPFYNSKAGNYIPEMANQQYVEWKGTLIPYFQCDYNMPNIEGIKILLDMVQKLKPAYVVAIGGSGVIINLIDKIVPTLTVGLSPSEMEDALTCCQTLSRPLNETDIKILDAIGKTQDSIIKSVFTSSLQPQALHVTREELGLPKDKFIIVVVGYRLDTDIDQQFADMLTEIMREDIVIAMIGTFETYDSFIAVNPQLKEKIFLLGKTSDILAWIEVCDLYVNPHRMGGGTSAVEALFMGIPVVTTAYGDVSVNVGEEFQTDSYATMPDLIWRYIDDNEFYQEMSRKAKERAQVLLDTESEFSRIIEEFKKRTE